jgi:hypothetical protein
MDIPDILKDLSPLLILLLIAFLKSKKGDEQEHVSVSKNTAPLPPLVESASVSMPQKDSMEALPMGIVSRDGERKRKKRSAKEMVIAQVILDKPLSL